MNKILIFDFDGVLANSLNPMLHYAEQVCQELGHPCNPTPADLEALERMEFTEYGRQLGIPEDKLETFVMRNHELFSDRKEPLELTAGMDSVIRSLSQNSLLAIVTGNSCKVVNKFLVAHGLKDEFQSILCAEDEGTRAEKILRIKELNCEPKAEFYMIGDAVSDIQSAHDTGIKSVAVGWGHQSKQKLLKRGPNFLVNRPEELLVLFPGEEN